MNCALERLEPLDAPKSTIMSTKGGIFVSSVFGALLPFKGFFSGSIRFNTSKTEKNSPFTGLRELLNCRTGL